jgi:hypothetical protein
MIKQTTRNNFSNLMFTSNFLNLAFNVKDYRVPAHKTKMPPGEGFSPGGINRGILVLLP